MILKEKNKWNVNRGEHITNIGHRQRLFNVLVAPHKEMLIETAIKLALNGNEAMLHLFLERLLPVKAVEQPLDIQGKTANEIISKLLNYVAIGEITADEASKLSFLVYKELEPNNQTRISKKVSILEQEINLEKKI